jgi:hypothetical protein
MLSLRLNLKAISFEVLNLTDTILGEIDLINTGVKMNLFNNSAKEVEISQESIYILHDNPDDRTSNLKKVVLSPLATPNEIDKTSIFTFKRDDFLKIKFTQNDKEEKVATIAISGQKLLDRPDFLANLCKFFMEGKPKRVETEINADPSGSHPTPGIIL